MPTTRPLAAVCVLLAGASLQAAAPPVGDPLPEGAIARLGHARMIAAPEARLSVSPDGKFIRAVWPVWSQSGEVSSFSIRWFRLSDGRDAPPVPVPDGCLLRHVFRSGAYLAEKDGRYLFFASAAAARPRAVLQSGENVSLYFDRAGRSCVRVEVGANETVLSAADLRGGAGWRWVARVKGSVSQFSLSDQGGHFAWWQDNRISVHDLKAGTTTVLPAPVPEGGGFVSPALSPDGKVVARLSCDDVHLIDVATKKVLHSVTGRSAWGDAEFTPDGKLLVVKLGAERALHAIPVAPGEKDWAVPLTGAHSFALFPDGRRVAVLDEHHVVRVHDLRTGKQLDTHSRFRGVPGVRMIGKDTAVTWTGCGKLVTWDVRSGRVLTEAAMPFEPARFSADGGRVAGWDDKGCLIAETQTGKVIARFPYDDVPYGTGLDFHPSGQSLWASEVDKDGGLRLKVLTPSGVRPVRAIAFESPQRPAQRFSPDGRFLLHASGSRAVLLETATGKPRWEATWRAGGPFEPSVSFFEITFDRKGRTAVVSRPHYQDATVFDVFTGRRLAVLPEGGSHSALSGSGRWLAARYGKGVGLWDLRDRKSSDPTFAVPLPGCEVKGIALDEDGSRLITAHGDGTCLVWELAALRARRPALDEWALLGGDAPLPAMKSLVAQPAHAVRLLGTKLAPVPPVSRVKIAGWIAGLGSSSFAERSAAEAALEGCLTQAEGQMRQALVKAPLEARLRLRRLLRRLDNRASDPSWLRQARGVEVLERIGSPGAVALLEKLAKGAPGAALTREAAEALARLR
jgi:WD40 repeat protein